MIKARDSSVEQSPLNSRKHCFRHLKRLVGNMKCRGLSEGLIYSIQIPLMIRRRIGDTDTLFNLSGINISRAPAVKIKQPHHTLGLTSRTSKRMVYLAKSNPVDRGLKYYDSRSLDCR